MLERLDRAFTSQQRFVADASHELRTPLAVIRTEVEVALADPSATAAELRAMGEVVRDATIRSEALVDGLLTLARTGAASTAARAVDLAEVAAQVVDRLAPSADELELALDLSLDRAPVRGDAALLDRLVENLVENALRYNDHGGWISVATGADATTASLRVANSGPLVPPEAVASLFDRFRRLDDWDPRRGRRGFGLGLSIVDAVARAHGGTATAEAQPDGGLLVIVELPAAAVVDDPALTPA
jgi:signal transduction histidine kinase